MMSVSLEPVAVGFCGNRIDVYLNDAGLQAELQQQLKHCLVDDGPLVSTYRVTLYEKNKIRIECDEEVAYDGINSSWSLLFLIQHLTSSLTGKCVDALNFHAAGIAWEDKGIILCAGSGYGKSTLTARLVAAGFRFLTDELIGVSLDSGLMTGFPRPIHLKPGSSRLLAHWLDETYLQQLKFAADGSVLIDPMALPLARVTRSVRPHYVIFPHYLPEVPFRVTYLSPTKTAFQLMQSLVNARNLAGHGFHDVFEFAKRVQGYSLEYADTKLAMNWFTGLVS